MKTKIFTFLAVICFSLAFTSCSEEEITPQDPKLEATSGGGVDKDDSGF